MSAISLAIDAILNAAAVSDLVDFMDYIWLGGGGHVEGGGGY